MNNVKLAGHRVGRVFFIVLALIQANTSADFGDVLLELSPQSGFGMAVDVSDGLIVVGSGDRQLNQFGDSVSVIDATTGEEVIRLIPVDGVTGFGTSVDIEGTMAIVGAVTSTVPLNEPGDDLGSAHVFDVDSGDELWTLTPDDARPGQRFGETVAIVDELNLALVGAPRDDELRFNGGAIYVFDLDTGKQLQKLTTDVERANRGVWTLLGSSIAVDGTRAAFGELNSEIADRGTKGAVQLFNLETLTHVRKFTNPESVMYLHDGFGLGVDIDGERLVVGSSGLADGCPEFTEGQLGVCNSGGAFVFNVETGEVLHKLTSPQLGQSDYFGSEVAVDGNIALIGSQNNGRAAYLFDISSGELVRRLVEDIGFNESGAHDRLAIDAGTAVIGAHINHTVFVVDVNRAPNGDFNQDGALDILDLDQLLFAVRSDSPDPLFDLTHDGVVGFEDVRRWVNEIKGTYFGDANLDGEFNSGDLISVFHSSKFESDERARWDEGDWNGDERFSSSDFVVAFQDGGFEAGPRAAAHNVPEPPCWILLTFGLSGIGRGYFRRRKPALLVNIVAEPPSLQSRIVKLLHSNQSRR